jgi:hypothetical protein
MPTSTPVVAIPVVDTSASMSYSGYVAITVIDTKAFLSNALAGDYVGVASYDVNGRVTYGLTLVDQNLTVPAGAAAAVQNLSFMGNSTNMGGGLLTAVGMLSSAPANLAKGLVLLSDGYQNYGTPPIPLPAGTPRVYSCAMGPSSDQNLMQQIATASGGSYYYAPYVYNMMTIYNQIRAQNPNSALLANAYKSVTPNDFLLIPATISAGNDEGQFSVVWSDTGVTFVNGQPGTNQISITLVNPAGTVLTPIPTLQGGGYVVFNIPNPAPGLWHIQIEYAGTMPQGLTGGAFEFSPSGNAPKITLTATAPLTVKAGAPIHFEAALEDAGSAILGQQVHAVITKPKISTRNAMSAYAPLLQDIQLPAAMADKYAGNPEVGKLQYLHQARMPQVDLLPHVNRSTFLAPMKNGNYGGDIPDTLQAGSYNIELQVTGHSVKSGSPFSRNHRFSVRVED